MVGELAPGTAVELLERVTLLGGGVRARTAQGWVTLVKDQVTDRWVYLHLLSEQELWERSGAKRLNSREAAEMTRLELLAKPRSTSPEPNRNPRFFNVSPNHSADDPRDRTTVSDNDAPYWRNEWPNNHPLKVFHPDEFETAKTTAEEIRRFIDVETFTNKGVGVDTAVAAVTGASRSPPRGASHSPVAPRGDMET